VPDAEPNLLLRAEDADDLRVLSACLQDAITRLDDVSFERRRHRFVLMASRFRWERQAAGAKPGGERVRAALRLDHVLSVRSRGIDRADPGGLLALLAATAEERADGVTLRLAFAGGGEIVLEAECIDAELRDVGEGWPTPRRPDHGLDGAENG